MTHRGQELRFEPRGFHCLIPRNCECLVRALNLFGIGLQLLSLLLTLDLAADPLRHQPQKLFVPPVKCVGARRTVEEGQRAVGFARDNNRRT